MESSNLPPILWERFSELSAREREIVAGLCSGASNEDLALSLDLTVSTVKTTLANVALKVPDVPRGGSWRLRLVLYAFGANASAWGA